MPRLTNDDNEELTTIVNVLSHFLPDIKVSEITIENRRAKLIDAMQALTGKNITTNDDIIREYHNWSNHVKKLTGKRTFNAIVNDTELFTDPTRVNHDLNILTTKELIKRYGAVSVFHYVNTPAEVERQLERYKALFAETKLAILQNRLSELTESEALMDNQIMQEQSELEAQIADNNRAIDEKTQQIQALSADRTDAARGRLRMSLQTTIHDRRRILNSQIYKDWIDRYRSYVDSGRSEAQIRHYMRNLSDDEYSQFIRNVQDLALFDSQIPALRQRLRAAEEAAVNYNRLSHEVDTLVARNTELARRMNAENVESNRPFIDRMNQLRPTVEGRRNMARENYTGELIRGRARNQEEFNQLNQEAPQLAKEPIDKIENYFNDRAVNQERLDSTIAALKALQRVDVSNFTNDERNLLKPLMLQAINETLANIDAYSSVRVIVGRNGESNGPKSMRFNTRDDAINFLKNWVSEGLVISYDDETHYQLTDGDRQSIAKLWTIDWFQIVVNNGAAAPGGGFPKFYFKRSGKADDDELAKVLSKYQIPDHQPTAADSPDMLEPCLMHCILQMEFWTDRQRQMVRELLQTRIRFMHVSATEAHTIFQELCINATIDDHDNGKYLEYYYDGKRLETSDCNRSYNTKVDRRGVMFGWVEPRKRIPTLKLHIYKQHYFLNEKTPLGVNSFKLIKQLEEAGRIAPLSQSDVQIFKRQLEVPAPVIGIKSYFSSCWKTVDEVVAGQQFKVSSVLTLDLANEAALKAYRADENPNGLVGYKLLLEYMKANKLNILADSGTVKHFLSQSVRGANVATENGKTLIVDEPVVSLDMNSCYWYALQHINVGSGLPKSISANMSLDDIMQIVKSGGIVFVECSYEYVRQHPLDVPSKKKLVLTSYDLLNPAYKVDRSKPIAGIYWAGDKVLQQPFNELVSRLYWCRKHVNNELKHVLNAGIGMLIHKYKPKYGRAKNPERIPSNVNYYGECDGKEIWINPIDYEYNYTQIHSLIMSYVQMHLQNIFLQCQARGVRLLYTSTDSLVIREADVSKVVDFIDETKLGFFKCEAKSEESAVFVGRGLYYINPSKYGTLNVPHACVENYCRDHNISILKFYQQLANGHEYKNMKYDGRVYSLNKDLFRTLYSTTILLS